MWFELISLGEMGGLRVFTGDHFSGPFLTALEQKTKSRLQFTNWFEQALKTLCTSTEPFRKQYPT